MFWRKPNIIIPLPEQRLFNILDFESWEWASNKSILWNGTKIYGSDKKPITEKVFMDLVWKERGIIYPMIRRSQ
jgi:hypothetical protein